LVLTQVVWAIDFDPFRGQWVVTFDNPITGALDLDPTLWTVGTPPFQIDADAVAVTGGAVRLRFFVDRSTLVRLEYLGPRDNFTDADGRTFGPFTTVIPFP
jgi:hypothetical protein